MYDFFDITGVQPQVLLYNFAEDERTDALRMWLQREGIGFRAVRAPEFLHPLGYLFEVNGFAACPTFNLGRNFKDEMMVLGGFSEGQLDELLAFFRKGQLAPVKLKAMLTPVNCTWNSLELHDELTKEHAAMK